MQKDIGINDLLSDLIERKRFIRKKCAECGERISEACEKLINGEPFCLENRKAGDYGLRVSPQSGSRGKSKSVVKTAHILTCL
jgi:hypothetical protein